MIVDTPIADEDVRARIIDASTIQERLERAEIFRTYLDNQWTPLAAKDTVFTWASTSKALRDEFEHVAESNSRRRNFSRRGW